MKILNKILKLRTRKYMDFIDLTDEIPKMIKKLKIKNGNVIVYSRHTTVAIVVNEKERGFHKDFSDLISKLVPKEKYYHHNDLTIRTENMFCGIDKTTDCLNGHSHCAHLLMGTSECIPIIDGKLMIGVWQRVFAIELDSARKREIIIQIIGE